ncbi:MAG: TIGR02206 family membrane protein [Candidatus Marinimicrobia bacterium]|jgi:hypothetical integral membrane protein (TIGR02206 family)|nr:TIGR02206 family membrane protein [Candidatus Neomarinimicrobiota bacterium]MDP6611683.1 TIGR02206 family membrane protein [Candidatus Neomarinimicrobiota bacterium]|tara:strand:- start:9444 stop:10172 length:729 start_codon:yes stop_codon:yes gene_type:complete
MRSAVAGYLNSYENFELFGPSHWTAIFLFLFLVFWLPWYGKNYLNPNQQNRVGYVMGVLIFINYPIWVLLESLGGSFDIALHLPFQLCRFANLLMPLVMIKRNFRTFEILYFWGLSGMLQGMMTPDIVQDFPHFHYFRYFVGHHLLVVALIYAVVVYDMKPTLNSLKKAFIALNIFLAVALFANILLDANYFWIMEKPPMASLLDYMGPWPWYILAGEFVALAHFGFAYLLFLWIEKRKISG